MTDVPEFQIAKLDVRAGDRVVLKTDHMLSKEQTDYIREAVQRQLPADVVVVVLGGGLSLDVLRKTDE
jgi:hypothetical protein